MNTQLLVTLIILLVFVVAAIFAILLFEKVREKQKRRKQEDIKVSKKQQPTDFDLNGVTAQELLPFEDIDSSMICLKDNKYRMVVEVSSLNYYLKTGREQETIEAIFRNAISSWDFPFMFYTQTREIDNDEIVNNLKRDVQTYAVKFPALARYSDQYIKAMEDMGKVEGYNLTKKHFIIICCDDAARIKAGESESAARDYVFRKLSMSVQKVYEGLRGLGLTVHCLNNDEVAELLYSAINKMEPSSKARDIKTYMGYVVEEEYDISEYSREQRLSLAFEGFENYLKNEVLTSHNYSSHDLSKAHGLLNDIESLKRQYFRDDYQSNDSLFDLSL